MAVRDGLFVAPSGGTGTSPTEARLALAGLLAPAGAGGLARTGIVYGPGSPGQVTGTANTSPLRYSVAAGVFVTQRTAAGGAYVCSTDGATTVDTTAAPASNSRWDLIWVRQQDAELGDASAAAVLGVTQGTAAASPSKPYGSVPAGALVLAEALVPSGATSTNGATITQVAPWTTGRGSTIPVRNQTERDALPLVAGLTCYRLDLNAEQIYNGSAWITPDVATHWVGVQATDQPVATNTFAGVTYTTVEESGAPASGSSFIRQVDRAGLYSLHMSQYFAGSSNGYRAALLAWGAVVNTDGTASNRKRRIVNPGGSGPMCVDITHVVRLNSGDKVGFLSFHTAGSSLDRLSGGTFNDSTASLHRVGA